MFKDISNHNILIKWFYYNFIEKLISQFGYKLYSRSTSEIIIILQITYFYVLFICVFF